MMLCPRGNSDRQRGDSAHPPIGFDNVDGIHEQDNPAIAKSQQHQINGGEQIERTGTIQQQHEGQQHAERCGNAQGHDKDRHAPGANLRYALLGKHDLLIRKRCQAQQIPVLRGDFSADTTERRRHAGVIERQRRQKTQADEQQGKAYDQIAAQIKKYEEKPRNSAPRRKQRAGSAGCS